MFAEIGGPMKEAYYYDPLLVKLFSHLDEVLPPVV